MTQRSLALAALSEVVDCVALFQGDDRLLPVLRLRVTAPHAAIFAAHDERVDAGDLHVEELLHGVANFDFVRVARDLEHDLVRAPKQVRLLGEDDRTTDDFLGAHLSPPFVPAAEATGRWLRQRASSAFAASCDRTSV